ncbi:hypothetical protein A3D03_01605 [Candidatus Gottesmanbacteria bacterium RIFCSPHIGHO2_02_FULL_40_13]|uniref:Phage holin family protein n=1 Tax=Candidatus Gottesmanbacteria bacterium RIFCSPHIGHO2_02_FULL_40_13 TaxID=1798384 RepID=A0A1F6A722_9BACT|nr:MAG: hypothetical protein A3D03_01605 [Candidatus Gottesmanbacteria bacterium RIFCSPHIGHO2_02_FULL_40_13]
MKLIADWIVRALVLLVTAYLVPGFQIESVSTALMVAFVLGILNLLIKPLLILLTLPLNILTLGLFTFVINAFLLLMASSLVRGFHVGSFFTAIVASIVISIVSAIISSITR